MVQHNKLSSVAGREKSSDLRRLFILSLIGKRLLQPRLLLRHLRMLSHQLKVGGITGGAYYLKSMINRRMHGTSSQGLNGPSTPYQAWANKVDTLSDADRKAIKAHISHLTYRPLISVVVPVYNTSEGFLREMIASVQAQLYPNWELCIADDASTLPHVAKVLNKAAAADPRIKVISREKNGHICAATNSALTLATGEFVALLDHDDLLPERALYEVAVELNAHPDANIVYSDEDKLDANGQRHTPYFKTDFSYDLLLGQNMINHFGVYRADVLRTIGGFREGYEGSQDYDVALRVAHHVPADTIRHIPAVLYHWRQDESSNTFSQSQLERCLSSARASIQDELDRTAPGARVEANPIVSVWNRVRWPLPDPLPKVSIIIPTRDRHDLLRTCVDGLLHRTDYANFEILIVDNDSAEPATHDLFAEYAKDARVRVLPIGGAFNYSALNNTAAKAATGDVLILLNNDIDVIEPDWLSEMVSLVIRPGVGIVGARLLYGDKRVQHAGVRLGAGVYKDNTGIAGHFGHFQRREDPGYFGQLALTRDVSAVTAACLAIRRDVYEQVGGLNENNLKVAFNDVDLCLRVGKAGYRILYSPFAELYHLESASRGSDMDGEKRKRFHSECDYMMESWGDLLRNDPFYNVNFDLCGGDYLLAFPPRRKQPWSNWLSHDA